MINPRCWFGRHVWFRLPLSTRGMNVLITFECDRCGLKRASVIR